MADQPEENPKNKAAENDAGQYSEPVDSAKMLNDVLQTVQERARGEEKPTDRLGSHQGAGSSEAQGLRDLFSNKQSKEQMKGLQELFQKGVLQPIDIDGLGKDDTGKPKALKDGAKQAPETAQFVGKDGKATTRFDNGSIEYNPSAKPPQQPFRKLDAEGKPSEIKDNDRFKIGDKEYSFKELKEKGIPGFDKDGNPSTTHLDGRVVTDFPKAKDGEVSQRTTYPEGYKHAETKDQGLRQTETIKGTPPGDQTHNSERTVKHFDATADQKARKVTEFAKGDIKSVTAFKDAKPGEPAAVTEYQKDAAGKGLGPEGADKKTTIKNANPPELGKPREILEMNPPNKDGVSKIEKMNFDPKNKDSVTQKTTYADGKVEATLNEKDAEGKDKKITLVEGKKAGEERQEVGKGDRTGVLDVNDKGLPTRMQIGDKDYNISYKDGKVDSMTIKSKGEPPSELALKMGPDGKLQVDKEKSTPPGKYDDPKAIKELTGLPIELDKDGKVVGDLSFSKNGSMRYKTGDGPDRQEYVKRPDGSLAHYDFKNWTREVTKPDGTKEPMSGWDGNKWRELDPSKTDLGKGIVSFKPEIDPKTGKPNPDSITRIERGTPPADETKFFKGDNSGSKYDWKNGTASDFDKSGKPVPGSEVHFDGANWRKADTVSKEQLDQIAKSKDDPKAKEAVDKDPKLQAIKKLLEKEKIDPSKIDKLTIFKDGQPNLHINTPEGASSFQLDKNGEVLSRVDRNKQNQVTETKGPEGTNKYQYDKDGDLFKVERYDTSQPPKKLQEMTRKGREQDPGMQNWLGRDGQRGLGTPGEPPPRDLSKPNGLNTWTVTDHSKDPPTTSEQKFNLNTTADGSERKEVKNKDGNIEVLTKPPLGESYTDVGNQRIVDRGNGMKETFDKSKNPPEPVSLEFQHNGKPVTLNAKDGPYEIGKDGSVKQYSKEKPEDKNFNKSKTYLPDGSEINAKVEVTPGADPKKDPPQVKETITEYTPGPNKPAGFPDKVSVPPAKSISRDSNTGKISVESEGLSEVYNPRAKTKSERKEGEEIAKVYKDGKQVGIDSKDGKPLARISNGGKSLDVPGHTLGDPSKWDLSKASMNQKGELTIPPAAGNDKTAVYTPDGRLHETKDGKILKTTFPNKTEANYKPDGSLESLTIGGKKYEPVVENGKITKLKEGGKEKSLIPEGEGFKLDESGDLVSEKTDPKTQVKEKITYDPVKDSSTILRTVDTPDGIRGLVYEQGRDGKKTVQGSTIPGLAKDMKVEKINADGSMELKSTDGKITAKVNSDLSAKVTNEGVEKSYAKDGTLIAGKNEKETFQGLVKGLEGVAAGDKAALEKAQTALFDFLRSGISGANLKGFQDSLNELLKDAKLSVNLALDNKTGVLSIDIKKDGKDLTKFSGRLPRRR